MPSLNGVPLFCEEILDRYGPLVYRMAIQGTGSVADGEDVAQEVFVSLIQSDPSFTDDTHLRAWLIRATANRCKSWGRSPWRKRTVPLELNQAAAPPPPENLDVLEAVAARIAAAQSVRLFGMGASGLVAEDLYYKLLRIDLRAIFCTDAHVQLTYITSIKPGDVAVFFSNSGRTTEVLELARAASERSACIVAVTKYGANPLAELADYVLPTSSPELEFRSGAMSSRIAALLVVDMLFTTLCNKNYDTVSKPLSESFSQCSKHHL